MCMLLAIYEDCGRPKLALPHEKRRQAQYAGKLGSCDESLAVLKSNQEQSTRQRAMG